MRLTSLSGICLASLLASGSLFSACGSSDQKRRPMLDYPGGGEGGEGATSVVAGSAGTASNAGTAGSGGTVSTTGGAGGDDTGAVAGGAPGAGGVPGAGGADTVDPAGGAGGEPPVNLVGLYVGPTGKDVNDGSAAAPFATLAHALSVATPGDVVVFLDGTYTIPTTVVVPAGVDIMAQHSGAVTLSAGANQLFTIKGDTRLEGLKFSGFQTVASFAGLNVDDTPGYINVVDSSFVGCSFSCLDLSNGAGALVTTSSVDGVLSNGSNGFATLAGNAQLFVQGGVIQNGAQTTLRSTDSTLDLNGVKVLNGNPTTVLWLRGSTVANLDGVVLSTNATNLVDIAGTVDFTAKNSDFAAVTAQNKAANCVVAQMDGVGSLVLEDTKLHFCGNGFKGAVPATLTLLRTEVYDIDYGMDLVTGGPAKGGTVRFTDSKVHDFTFWGFRLGDNSSLMDFKMRGTEITVPATATSDGLIIAGSNASTYDLGTLASPGGNIILGATVNTTGLRIGLAAVTVQAVGNTWVANAEGADNLGKYSAPTATAGDKLDITAAVTSGRNYIKGNALTTLRLAQNP